MNKLPSPTEPKKIQPAVVILIAAGVIVFLLLCPVLWSVYEMFMSAFAEIGRYFAYGAQRLAMRAFWMIVAGVIAYLVINWLAKRKSG